MAHHSSLHQQISRFKLALKFLASTIISALLYCAPTYADNTLPELNDSASLILNAEDEVILGRRLMLAARGRLKLIDDPILLDYVQTLTNHLASFSSRALPDLQVSIANNPTINAFAAPGGQIAINTGLLSAAQTEGELASVIAHEISHHSQRHIPRMLENAKKVSLPSAAALIGGLLVGGQVGVATIAAVRAAVISNQLEYSRGFEQEADASGMKMLAQAGFDPLNMPAFFGRLERQNQTQGSDVPEFLRTHPLSTNRIADAKARVRSLGLLVEDKPLIETLLDFDTAKARTKALYGEPIKTVIAQFSSGELASGVRSPFANAYGLALSLMRENKLQEADAALTSINPETNKQRDLIQLAHAELLIQLNQKQRALVLLQTLREQHPTNLGIGLLSAITTKRLGLLDEAYKQARKIQRKHPKNPETHLILADIAGAQGNFPSAAFSKAQYFYEIGDYARASATLKLYSANDKPEVSDYIQSRMTDLQNKIATAQTRSNALKL